MGELGIQVARVHRQLVFTLLSSSGRAPQVEGVTVVDPAAQSVCWSLLPTVRYGFDAAADLGERMRASGLQVPPGVDAIEDLSPTDPRYRVAEHQILDMVEQGSLNVRTLIYGVVPSGFLQVTPSQGSAAALEAGHVYELHVWGEEEGSLVFTAL
jgi:hypothetical protein